MLEPFDFYKLTIDKLSIEAAKISLERDCQICDSDPVKIAETLYFRFKQAREFLFSKTRNDIMDAFQKEANNENQ